MKDEKVKFLKFAIEQLKNNELFIANSLNDYIISKNLTEEQLILKLECSVVNYYKLALCKLPEKDFDERLKIICNYSGINFENVKKILIID